MTPAAIAATGACYGLAAFALSVATSGARLADAWRTQTIDAYRVKLICVTLGSAVVGCFTATRGLTVLQTAATALIVPALAGTMTAPRWAPRALLFYVSAVPIVFVLFSAALDGMWPALFSATFVALPFLLTALFVADRNASFQNAAVAALAGASIGVTSAFFVLCAASLCGIATTTLGRRSFENLRLAPYIAAFTLLGILLNMSILT